MNLSKEVIAALVAAFGGLLAVLFKSRSDTAVARIAASTAEDKQDEENRRGTIAEFKDIIENLRKERDTHKSDAERYARERDEALAENKKLMQEKWALLANRVQAGEDIIATPEQLPIIKALAEKEKSNEPEIKP